MRILGRKHSLKIKTFGNALSLDIIVPASIMVE